MVFVVLSILTVFLLSGCAQQQPTTHSAAESGAEEVSDGTESAVSTVSEEEIESLTDELTELEELINSGAEIGDSGIEEGFFD